MTGVADTDAAAEEQVHLARVADAEQPGVLEEERTLLGEEQREAIQVDLLIVHFDLREVGVHRGVEGEAGGQTVLQVAADLAEPRRSRGFDARLERVTKHIRRDPKVAQRRRLHATKRARERQPIQVELPGNGCPVGALVLAPDVALKVDAPGLIGRGGIPQRAERNGKLRLPPFLRDLRAHRPCAVPVDVEPGAGAARLHAAKAQPATALAFVGDLAVVLDAGGVGAEHEPVLAIAVGVDDHLEAVGVVQRRITPRVGDDDAVWIRIEQLHADVQRVGREDHAHFRPLGCGLALVWLLLPEVGDRRRHLPCRIASDVAVDGRRLGRSSGWCNVSRARLGLGRGA